MNVEFREGSVTVILYLRAQNSFCLYFAHFATHLGDVRQRTDVMPLSKHELCETVQ
jgi:hypothetical protein